ncbi:uncharacterized protein F54H12.2 [Trichonephila clavipes]|uniref:Uncharacterized protein F54H12.2 n=1 Tax=Trichonephila clavipes TaxID=2585209 RepID=A0A8X6SIL2_TRICX|nr:uncharacterized protein F54H12.2 [Trichonephila clavipes]
MHQDLAAFYENPKVPNSFGGVEALHRSVKGKYSKKDVKHWLSQKDAYTLHKPVRHKFQRNRVLVSDIDRQFQADLVDMQSLAEFNKGYKYLLTCIDLFSKFAWAVPPKDKFGKSVKSGLEIIFKERKPKVLQTDAGKDGETISQYYDRPQYLPLVRHSFQTIQSELRLNSGDFVPFERGQIGSGLTHYKGINFQKGYGIGGIFRRLFKAALPFLVKGGKTIGKEVLMTGSRVASDVLSGENFKEAVKTRSRESGKKLAQKAIDRVQSMVGKGQYKRKHSPECVKSELELFNLPGTQTVIQDGQWKQFHPLSNVFDNAPDEFHISGSADYIDLSQTQLYVKAKIVKVDNTPITKDDTIGPVNLFLHSLFSQVDVSLNDRVVSNSSNTYPYRDLILKLS